MTWFDDFSRSPVIVYALIILLAIVLIAFIVVTFRFRRQQRDILRQEEIDREVARRRRIRVSEDYLDSLCEGLGDYLLLEADHIRSVSQGGTGKDIDNLQCLCWRCNRKKGGRRTNEQVRDMIDYGMEYLYRNRDY